MADLATALDAALGERYRIREVKSPITTRRGLTARMNQLEALHARKGDRPGQAATRAAESAGIPARTWQYWRSGTRKASAKGQRKLEQAYARQITLPAYRKLAQQPPKKPGQPQQPPLKPPPARVTVTAEIWWTDSDKQNNGDKRTVKLTGMKAAMARVIRAWTAAGPEAAAETFERETARVYSVPDNDDGSPGVQFKGDDVTITFPGED